MLDCQIYGMNPGQHHLTNVLFHILNTLLLFLVFKRMTGDLWQSGFVAALFALHPLHVESVAWVAERKDVLSTFFLMLTMWSYTRYVEHSEFNKYLLVILFFIIGLMAKPMLVTLPFVLLLFDYWPLKRFQLGSSGENNSHEKAVLLGFDLGKNTFIPFIRRVECWNLPCSEKQWGSQFSGCDSISYQDCQCHGFLCQLHRKNDLA